jgi:hypothetical protein
MKKINNLLAGAGKGLMPRSDASQTAAGQSSKHRDAEPGAPDLIDAINQIFAEFELAYHNQYYKAYGDSDRLILAKKYWLECLAGFQPHQLVAAARRLVRTQEFLPTISAMIKTCEQGIDLFGLPSPRDAYIEACRASAPKAEFHWSHPAVYHAGRAADWFVLASEPEERAFPLFAHYYGQLCERVMRGTNLELPVVPALPATLSRHLSFEERAQQLQRLRAELDL